MRQQLSPAGIWLLAAVLLSFWLAIVVLIRVNARRRGAPARAVPPAPAQSGAQPAVQPHAERPGRRA